MTAQPKFIVVTFDGLRRDMITPELAPTLTQFLAQGTDFPLSRSVFPSQTRVNAAALSAGAAPIQTGVVANKFFDRSVFTDRAIHTGKYEHFLAAQDAYGGCFIDTETLGECAGHAGLNVAVVSTASAGTTSLLHPNARKFGHVILSLRDWNASTPKDIADNALQRFGPLPPEAKPNVGQIICQTDMLLGYVLPELDPDITFVWFSDPDSTYHPCGLGSPESCEAIRNVDAQFARILSWVHESAEAERYQIFVMSDHGQITAKTKIDIKGHMAEGGLGFDQHFEGDADFAGVAGYSSAIRVRDGDTRHMASLIDWFSDQPWQGLLFTPNGNGIEGSVPGTFDRALLQVAHARAPEVYFTLQSDDSENQWGMPGSCYYASAAVPEGGGTHGGLHPIEMNNLLAVQGSAFKESYQSAWPASHTDIAPTILNMMGIQSPATMTGRLLAEAITSDAEEPPEPEVFNCSVERASGRQSLRYWRVGTSVYLDHGWVE